MFKKVMAIVLALSMLLCLAACAKEDAPADAAGDQGGASGAAPDSDASTGTEGAASAPVEEEKRLDELVAETNPANKYEELIAARDICQEQFQRAVASVEQAGLSEDTTLSELTAEWKQLFDDLHAYLFTYEGASAEELNALEGDADFQYYAGTYLSHLRQHYNMTSALARDPALWLERYTLVPQSAAEVVETDGSWPAGYFFSDRVPALESIDGLMMSETGKEYGFENGVEYALFVNAIETDQALAYVDQLIGVGFREENRAEAQDVLLWFGKLNDGQGHISAIVMYNGNADGTAANPALMVQFYCYDIIGIMTDLGQLY